jgi:hypothetical protein
LNGCFLSVGGDKAYYVLRSQEKMMMMKTLMYEYKQGTVVVARVLLPATHFRISHTGLRTADGWVFLKSKTIFSSKTIISKTQGKLQS